MYVAIPAWLFLYLLAGTYSVPPDVCFENFNWEDCGRAPKAVLYYYKPGSRCEVGLWRGCLPNPNMFRNEYQCVQTCIFTVRAHEYFSNETDSEDYDSEETTTELTYTNSTGTETVDSTGTMATVTEENNATVKEETGTGDTLATESVTGQTATEEGENKDTEQPQAEAEPEEKK